MSARRRLGTGCGLLAAGGAGAALAYFLDPDRGRRRRHVVRDRALAAGRRGARRASRRAHYAASYAQGMGRRARAAMHDGERAYDDVTLARVVESELFRKPDTPKEAINVNAHDGVVELRGQVASHEQVRRLGSATAHVAGVRRVENLLHTPGEAPKHAAPHDPRDSID